MRRVFLLLSACLVMSLAFAPAAGAQTVFPQSDGSGDTIGDGCPAGEVAAIPPNTLGEGGFACFATQEEAAYYAETGQLLPEQQAQNGGAQAPALGNSTVEANDPAEFDRSELNPNGPCFDPQIAPDVTGVPVEDLALAYVNRNDPPGTPLVSPLDSDNNGIACDALTQQQAQALLEDADTDDSATAQSADDDQYAEDDDVTALPDTGGLPLAALAAGLVMVGLGGLLLKRRMS